MLRQAFAHCAIFLAAATRRYLVRVSVPVWGVTLSRPLPVSALVSHYLTNKLMGRRPLPERRGFSYYFLSVITSGVLATVSSGCPPLRGRSPTCYSPVRHSHLQTNPKDPVRLACIRHTASVHPEPGSNSPLKEFSKSRLKRDLWFKVIYELIGSACFCHSSVVKVPDANRYPSIVLGIVKLFCQNACNRAF